MPSGEASWLPYPREMVIAGRLWAEELSTFSWWPNQSGWRPVLVHLAPISLRKGADRSGKNVLPREESRGRAAWSPSWTSSAPAARPSSWVWASALSTRGHFPVAFLLWRPMWPSSWGQPQPGPPEAGLPVSMAPSLAWCGSQSSWAQQPLSEASRATAPCCMAAVATLMASSRVCCSSSCTAMCVPLAVANSATCW